MYISPHERLSARFKRQPNNRREVAAARRERKCPPDARPPARTPVRLVGQRRSKRKSLPNTETKTNTVKNHIARAQDAPHPNADGATALERFATPQ
jgi:hypothetical protein